MRSKAVLVDDEPLALARLERMLAEHARAIEIVGTAGSGEDAVARINELRPDVVFLDVQMPELTGFDVLDRLDYIPLVVFTTAYDQYALQAFEVYSVDYLVKPIDPRRLKVAVEKLGRIRDGAGDEQAQRVRQARESLAGPGVSRIPVRTGDRIRLVPVADVVFFRAQDKYTEVHTAADSHLITKSLARLEEELSAQDFVRISRSAIVNLNCIREIAKDDTGAYEVRLQDSHRTALRVSRRYRARLDL